MAICFFVLLVKANPNWGKVFLGYLPTKQLVTDPNMLFVAIAIVGAVVMPHNLYLHSHIVMYRAPVVYNRELLAAAHSNNLNSTMSHTPDVVQSLPSSISPTSEVIRQFNSTDGLTETDISRPLSEKARLPIALRYTNVDSLMALTLAFLINSAILIVAGAAFFSADQTNVAGLEDAHSLLVQYLGPSAGVLFAISLFMSGQSSTFTGTLAGQIVMEGFLGNKWNVAPWLRRLITRIIAILPAVIVALVKGQSGVNDLLVLSQVVLSLQLPFAVWPLVFFTSSKKLMTVKFRKTFEDEDDTLQTSDVSDEENENCNSNDESSIHIDDSTDVNNNIQVTDQLLSHTRHLAPDVAPSGVNNGSFAGQLSRRESRSAVRESVDITYQWRKFVSF